MKSMIRLPKSSDYTSRLIAPLDSLPVFHGGWVGYFSYDTVRYVEPKLANTANQDALNTPDILLMLAEEVIVFDNLRGTLTLIVSADTSEDDAFQRSNRRLLELETRLAEPMPPLASFELGATDTTDIESRVTFETDQATFESWVARVKDYILDGDVMQVVISQRMTLPFLAEPLNLYRALRHLNPSPYLFFLNLDDFHVVGSSPRYLFAPSAVKLPLGPLRAQLDGVRRKQRMLHLLPSF